MVVAAEGLFEIETSELEEDYQLDHARALGS